MYIILNKEKSILKVKLTQLEIIEVKYLAKVSRRRAEVYYTEIKWKVNITQSLQVDYKDMQNKYIPQGHSTSYILNSLYNNHINN